MAYLTTFNHWMRKLSFVKNKGVKYRVWVNKKPTGNFLEKNKKNKKIKIRFFCRKISEKLKSTSTKFPSYRPVGTLAYLVPTLPKNHGLNRRFEKSKCFNTFYIYLIFVHSEYL